MGAHEGNDPRDSAEQELDEQQDMLPAVVGDDDELITVGHACRLLGGAERPLNRSTLYRNINAGRYQATIVHPSPGISRLSKQAVLRDRARIIKEGS